MKSRNLIFIFPLLITISIYAEENIQVVNEYINFELPNYVLNFDELPYPENPVQRNTFREGKIVYRLTTKNIDELHNERPYMLSDTVRDFISKEGTITEVDILNLFNKGNKFVLSNYFPMSLEYTSYNHFYHNGEIIGEFFFGAATDGLLVTSPYGYTLNLISNGKIINFWINLFDGSDQHIPEMLPNIFNKRENYWFWNSRDSRMHLYKLMKDANENDLPQGLIKLQKAWESILKTIRINNSNTQAADVKGWIYGGYVAFDTYNPELLPTLD